MKRLIFALLFTFIINTYASADGAVRFFPKFCAVQKSGSTLNHSPVRSISIGTLRESGSPLLGIEVIAENNQTDVAGYFVQSDPRKHEPVQSVVFTPDGEDPDKDKLNSSQGSFAIEAPFNSIVGAEGTTPQGTRFKAVQFMACPR